MSFVDLSMKILYSPETVTSVKKFPDFHDTFEIPLSLQMKRKLCIIQYCIEDIQIFSWKLQTFKS